MTKSDINDGWTGMEYAEMVLRYFVDLDEEGKLPIEVEHYSALPGTISGKNADLVFWNHFKDQNPARVWSALTAAVDYKLLSGIPSDNGLCVRVRGVTVLGLKFNRFGEKCL